MAKDTQAPKPPQPNPEAMTEQEHSDLTDVQRWEKAVETAPTDEQVANINERYTNLTKELASITKEREHLAVRRALVHGFDRVAKEFGVTSKQIHVWRRTHNVPGEDLSSVPHKAMRRNEQRIKRLEQRLAADRELAQLVADHKKNVERIKKAMQA